MQRCSGRARRGGQQCLRTWLWFAACSVLGACVDNASTVQTEQPQSFGGLVRGAVGCQAQDDELVAAAQSLLGCHQEVVATAGAPSLTDPGAPPPTVGPSVAAAGGPAPIPAPALAGSGGQGGIAGAAGMRATAGASSVPSPAGGCGGTSCTGAAGVQGCCLDATAGTCGVLMGATCAPMPPPTSNQPCPGVDLTRQGYGMLMPCCTADRQCGVNTQRLPGGMPCTALADAKRTAESMGFRGLVPEPRACPAP